MSKQDGLMASAEHGRRPVQDWFAELLGLSRLPREGGEVAAHGIILTMRGGILREQEPECVSPAQQQTSDAFGFKWAKRDTFEGGPLNYLREWLLEQYGNVATAPWLFDTSDVPILLDAGCGAAMSALALFEPVLDRIRYLGVDVSTAVEVAKTRFDERGRAASFLQADLNRLPLPEQSVDLIFSEGVLHHTDNTAAALAAVVRYLKIGGRILFYVYRKKGPIREFTDDFIRDKLGRMTPEQGWEAMIPLTKLGKILGELNIEIEIPESIELLDIPAGRIDLQRLFYWHVLKAYYRPEMSLEEMNHLNFDWYAPKNAHRHTVDEVRLWCERLSLAIEHEYVQQAGITIIARRRSAP
jgi:SAM-dependent methyltransferase